MKSTARPQAGTQMKLCRSADGTFEWVGVAKASTHPHSHL